MLVLPSDTALSVGALQDALNAAGDEDDRLEVKGTEIKSEHVSRAVAGLANRDGGALVIGASQANGTWVVDGVAKRPDGEPGKWISDALANLAPSPPYTVRLIDVDPAQGTWAAVIEVDRADRDLVVLPNGKVHHRHHGRTNTVKDGATLTSLVLRRAGVGADVPARLDAALDATELGDEVLRAITGGAVPRVRPLTSQLAQALARAVQFETESGVDAAADRLTAVAAVLATNAPDARETAAALESFHRAMELILAVRDLPGQHVRLDLFRSLRPRVLALGGLLVRNGDWEGVRRLTTPRGPMVFGHPRSWLLFVDSEQARASPVMRHADGRAHPVRAGREVTARLPALRPDHADEHQALDSILQFDLAAALIEAETAADGSYELQIWPGFTAFDERAVRPVVDQLLRDTAMQQALLPGSEPTRVARLIGVLNRVAAGPESGFWSGILSPEAIAEIDRLGPRAKP